MLSIATVAKEFRIDWNLSRSGEFIKHVLPFAVVVAKRFALIEFCMMDYQRVGFEASEAFGASAAHCDYKVTSNFF